jgi:hypothetical protein
MSVGEDARVEAIKHAQNNANRDGVTRYVWKWGAKWITGRVAPKALRGHNYSTVEVSPTPSITDVPIDQQ